MNTIIAIWFYGALITEIIYIGILIESHVLGNKHFNILFFSLGTLIIIFAWPACIVQALKSSLTSVFPNRRD